MTGDYFRWLDLPPVWLIATMALAWVIGWALPAATLSHPALNAAGWVLIAAGAGLMGWCGLWFRRRRTSIIPRQKPEALITEGPYRMSRNPIYLADAVILAGWVTLIGAPLALVTLPLFAAIINRRFIAGEEAVLGETFGAEFTAWCKTVRRWI